MQKSFMAQEREGVDDDVEYFANHPLNCKELTPEVLARPEFQALHALAYEGTPEEVCKNFKEHAMEALHDVIMKHTKTAERDQVECERAMHFFDQAFATGWKEHQALFTLYMGRAKLNLLLA